jgi:acetyl-CoA synthetase
LANAEADLTAVVGNSKGARTMRDYQSAYREFSVAKLEREVLRGSLADGLNACVESCDRWTGDNRVALEWIGRDETRETVTFPDLQDASARFANLLHSDGIGRGDTVAGLLPRIPELLVVVLGTWRMGAIYQPLFTACEAGKGWEACKRYCSSDFSAQAAR